MNVRTLGRGTAALALGTSLTIAPVAIPAAQAAHVVDARGLPGLLGGIGVGPVLGGAGQPGASPATDAQSVGVVLIDTILDYGEGAAAGTGLAIGSTGLVVTNHHVIEDSTKITVTTPDGTSYGAQVVGYDATHDVAVLQLKGASGLPTVTTDTDGVTKGEAIDAIGNAEGQGSLTDAPGDVTDPSRNITVTDDDGSKARLTDLIESNADVVPGDSGGAWLDADGEVVGMTVAATDGGLQTYGYAIPISRVLNVATKIENGRASKTIVIGTRAAIGIELTSAKRLKVASVQSQPARKAGLRRGDVITAADGTTVTTIAQLTRILRQHQPGDHIKLAWTTPAGAHRSARIRLISGPVD